MAWSRSTQDALRGSRVLLTGHTGFKGAWLSLWLEMLGVEVVGLSLPTMPGSLYDRAGLAGRWTEGLHDIRDASFISKFVRRNAPDFVVHMAAQPLVSEGFSHPVETFETNVVGTINVLEAVRHTPSVRGCVVVTTDKVYRPSSVAHRHAEVDPLGGKDPYSASKSACEHVVTAWRVLLSSERDCPLVAVRAGNVIGGGDAAENRLMPDLMRAFSGGRIASVRQPSFTRPWQHVLDPLSGYLAVLSKIAVGESPPEALNFGPEKEESVEMVADLAATFWGAGASWKVQESDSPMAETPLLALSSELAHQALGWSPQWSTDEAVERTVAWWRGLGEGVPAVDLCLQDLQDFMRSSDIR